ncbi:hypothetical protein B0T24DRAFT_682718 [Lasiosphaeria ovina]|uniref:Uncharacterized protein n=1 Tax=Lasiosphaeria ovina TaxID=92902 RepID=A0AAE0JWF8_9PEZI|nr:hypothetical protein B0T24DRAFT_682718 [Lasiosphaeria ovina]
MPISGLAGSASLASKCGSTLLCLGRSLPLWVVAVAGLVFFVSNSIVGIGDWQTPPPVAPAAVSPFVAAEAAQSLTWRFVRRVE